MRDISEAGELNDHRPLSSIVGTVSDRMMHRTVGSVARGQDAPSELTVSFGGAGYEPRTLLA